MSHRNIFDKASKVTRETILSKKTAIKPQRKGPLAHCEEIKKRNHDRLMRQVSFIFRDIHSEKFIDSLRIVMMKLSATLLVGETAMRMATT